MLGTYANSTSRVDLLSNHGSSSPNDIPELASDGLIFSKPFVSMPYESAEWAAPAGSETSPFGLGFRSATETTGDVDLNGGYYDAESQTYRLPHQENVSPLQAGGGKGTYTNVYTGTNTGTVTRQGTGYDGFVWLDQFADQDYDADERSDTD